MDGYEYGIRHWRNREMHRWGMTAETAQEFMDPAEWDVADPTRLYEIVRRPVGDWEPVPQPVVSGDD